MASKRPSPSYRSHVPGQAVVTFTVNGDQRAFYLGKYDSPQSRARYYALIHEYEQSGRTRIPEQPDQQLDLPVSVSAVTGEYRRHIAVKYANNKVERQRHGSLCDRLEAACGPQDASERTQPPSWPVINLPSTKTFASSIAALDSRTRAACRRPSWRR